MINPFNDEYFMKEALKEAEKAGMKDEVPIGAVVVLKDQIIGRGHNLTEQLKDVTAHAEMQAITAASEILGAKYLIDCKLYVTMEPCVMCAGALAWSQISKIIYAAKDEKRGAGSLETNIYHPKTEVIQGPFEQEASILVKSFFSGKRN